ncbi:hypothetical protein HKX48_005672 [Thoreauomyces humboldtii]|nr:hypothetical protein HKX48_005672 [Thoreauomyces humboldtii]
MASLTKSQSKTTPVRSYRSPLSLLALVLLQLLVLAPLASSQNVTTSTGTVTSDVSLALPTRLSLPLPGSYVGLSIEWTHVQDAVGTGESAVADGSLGVGPIVSGLMASLRNSSGGWPVHVRIGGNSATKMWWQGSTLPRLGQMLWSVNAGDLAILQTFAVETFSKLTLTVSMLSTNPAYAVEFITKGILVNIAPANIFAIEIGNEPDHYAVNARRPLNYTFDDFLGEYTEAYDAITTAVGPSVGFDYQGPAYAYEWTQADLTPFMQGEPGTKMISFHKYGQAGCSTKTNPNAVTPYTLLDDPNPDEYEWLDALAASAASGNQSLVWGEGGSASCNGTAGTSDTFVSALWTVDMMMEMAYRQIIYTAVSGAGQTYGAPYSFDDELGRVTVRPAFYGLIATNRLLRGSNSRVFRAEIGGAWALTGNATKTWGVLHSNGEMSLAVIEKSGSPLSVNVAIPSVKCNGSTTPQGYISHLVSPNSDLTATTGITINGQTWDGSLDGLPVGPYGETVVPVTAGGTYVLAVPAYSVTTLRIGCEGGLVAVEYVPPPAATMSAMAPGAVATTTWNGTTPNVNNPTAVQDAEETPQRVGALVGIGIAAIAVALATGLAVFAFWRRGTAKQRPMAATHAHPYANGNVYLGKQAGEMV